MVETAVGIKVTTKDRLQLTVIALSGDQWKLRTAVLAYPKIIWE
jgi:hypothetical protein